MTLTNGSVLGRTVIASDGLAVGEIAAFIIECETWHVESLVVKLRDDIADRLGADHGIFRAGSIEVPTRIVQSVGDAVLLSAVVDDLRQIVVGRSEAPTSD